MDKDAEFLGTLLDNLKDPFLFADGEHIIRYLNKTAREHYKAGEKLLGTSIFDCHNEESGKVIRQVFAEMQEGLTERLITDNKKNRIYMRSVRNGEGNLLGYYERFEPPLGAR